MGSIDKSNTGTLDKSADTSSFTDVQFEEDGTLIHDIDTVSSNSSSDGTGYYLVDSGGSIVTFTLSSADAVDGQEINVKRNGSNTVTLDTEGGETIDGSNTYDLSADDESVTVVFNSGSTNWEIV